MKKIIKVLKQIWSIFKYIVFMALWSLYFYYLFWLERPELTSNQLDRQSVHHYQFYSLVGVIFAFYWWVNDRWKLN